MSQDQEDIINSSISSIPERPELAVIGSSLPTRLLNRYPRRGSSAVKMLSEDYNQDNDVPSRRASTPEKRNLRNSVVKLIEQQEFARRFSAPEKTRSRRSSSIVKTLSEEEELRIEIDEPSSRRSSRSGSIVKMTSEDNFADDECSRRSSRAEFTDFDRRRPSMRRGSSVVRMLSEEQHDSDKSTKSDPIISESTSSRSENAEKFRKSADNGYKHSLESISEYKTKSFQPGSFYPCLESPTLDCLSDFAQTIAESFKDTDVSATSSGSNYLSWLDTVNSDNYGTPRTDSDNKSGEWNYFWSNYNSSSNQYFSSPYLCPSNSVEDLSDNTPQLDKGSLEKIVFTLDEVNEALHCAQRVADILKDALKRAEDNEHPVRVPSLLSKVYRLKKKNFSGNSYYLFTFQTCTKEEKVQNTEGEKKNVQKTTSNSCIDVFLSHTGVADILKRVLNKRREVIMPSEDSPKSTGSTWTSFDSTRK